MSAENISYDLKRFAGIKRDYTPEEVERLRGSIKIEHSMCKHQSKKLWDLLNSEPYINTLGSLSGNHAVQHAKAGLKAIYLVDGKLLLTLIVLVKCTPINLYTHMIVHQNWLSL